MTSGGPLKPHVERIRPSSKWRERHQMRLSVDTAASPRGVSTVLRRHNPNLKVIAVEPGESAVLSGGRPGAHDIEGIGISFQPPLWDASLVDEVIPVNTKDAKENGPAHGTAGRHICRDVFRRKCKGCSPACGATGVASHHRYLGRRLRPEVRQHGPLQQQTSPLKARAISVLAFEAVPRCALES